MEGEYILKKILSITFSDFLFCSKYYGWLYKRKGKKATESAPILEILDTNRKVTRLAFSNTWSKVKLENNELVHGIADGLDQYFNE